MRARRPGRGTLAIIAGFLIASAGLRLAPGAGAALARAGEDTPAVAGHVPAQEQAACAPPKEIAPVLDALRDREARLDRQETRLRDRLHALAVAEEEITFKTGELRAAEDALRATIALADSAAEDDITRLVSVYEAMKPKDAAALFETMDPEFAAGFLGRMQPAAAAGVMAGLSPRAAYSVSVILAGRNMSVPTE
ncbi:Flagellar motility protein MotE, a chaperone for MotC folding [Lutimaribacter pacificus]|uniref:Flagellar motility protein MotE, a chaperone for MotC folding n=1 Tax=Lutimaribacter pacificus TaxID=391948 RepID=A0A1H0EDZ2_9RHOB|nr:hypothetical protein [Lutimaribacter pacificus]SDN80645.1 Flagellar motility protein MotE, a chaperone for MotC folding [Lutimaribacter pacificus]SHK53909.1 Flagellar motility protein MotE, a chaperone for MotC folding [Lutimaribacter pacificus]